MTRTLRRPMRCLFPIVVALLVTAGDMIAQERQSERDGGDSYIVISITPFGEATFDVKLKNPRTGYVHSVTITIDIAQLLHVGDRVRQRNERGRIILIPIGGGDRPKEVPPPPEPQPPPLRWPSWDLPAQAADLPLPPCAKFLPCEGPLPLGDETNLRRRLDVSKVRAMAKVHVATMRFLYDRLHPSEKELPDGCDVLTSGSFTSGGREPVGPLRIRGVRTVAGYSDKTDKRFEGTSVTGVTTKFRGAIILSADGTPAIIRQTGDLQSDLIRGADVMGGGALLLHQGRKVDEDDLCCCQGFVDYYDPKRHNRTGKTTGNLDPTYSGFQSGQLADGAKRIVVASRGDQFYVFATSLGGKLMQQDLFDAGFEEAVLLDGGRGAFMVNRGGVVFDGRVDSKGRGEPGSNSTRLCITTQPPLKRR